jgi:hypothetical protein
MEKRTPTGFGTQDCPTCNKSLPHPSPQNLYCEFSLYLLHRYRKKEAFILHYSVTLYQQLKLLSIECLKMTSQEGCSRNKTPIVGTIQGFISSAKHVVTNETSSNFYENGQVFLSSEC